MPTKAEFVELSLIPMGTEHGRPYAQGEPPPPLRPWRPTGVTWQLIRDLRARIARIEELLADRRYATSGALHTELCRLQELERFAYHWYVDA